MAKKNVFVVLVVYFLYAISFTLVVPAFPSLLLKASEDQYTKDASIISTSSSFTNTTLLTNTTLIYKDESIDILSTSSRVRAGARASLLYGVASFMKYFLEFFSSPLLGNLSDSYGRKIILLLSLFAFCFEFLILSLYPSVLSVFITRGISGLLDNTTSNIHAIVTDIAQYNNESVTKTFGAIGKINCRYLFTIN
jgi:MFS family permease